MKYVVKKNQAGFVLKKGIFKKMITSGTYHFSRSAGYEVELEEMTGELEYRKIPYQILSRDTSFAKATVHIKIPEGYVGFIYENGKLVSYAECGEHTFWNVFDKYDIKLISMADPEMGEEVSKQMLSLLPPELYTEIKVREWETGLVYYDNAMQKQLSRGIYRYWNYKHNITYQVFDIRQREFDVLGLNIFTRDKIEILMNFACMYKIRDVAEFAAKISDLNLKGQPYYSYSADSAAHHAIWEIVGNPAELAIQEVVGKYKLDKILKAKAKISKEIYAVLKEKEAMSCVDFLSADIDIIY